MTDAVWAVIVAAGAGERFGGLKQFAPLAGRSVVEWSVASAREAVGGIVLVVPREIAACHAQGSNGPGAAPREALAACDLVDRVVAGGPTRAASVREGLEAVPDAAEIVVVHDAARPLASPSLFEAVVGAVARGADGAIPCLDMSDTVKRVRGREGEVVGTLDVVETLDRKELMRAQTPQAFRAVILRRGHACLPDTTDDSAVVEGTGATVVVVPGESENLKITSELDLKLAEWLLAGRARRE